jgi:homoserine dehydrogenase
MPPLTFALLGFGTVGQAVARLVLSAHPTLRLTHIFNREIERKRVDWVPGDVVWTENVDEVLASPLDAVVEVAGGLEPAGSWVTRALESGKAVVTANKQLLAHRGSDLLALASARDRGLRFEAAVCGGLPVVRMIGEGLASDRLHRIAGVMNGTCSYILTRMEREGLGMDEALHDAQERGYAEADPTDDIDGHDAQAKLCVLSRIGLQQAITPDQVACTSVRDVASVDFTIARRLGYTIRQIAEAEHDVNTRVVRCRVGPALVPLDSLFARVTGTQNVLQVSGDYSGETAVKGLGAGGDATAVAVVSDLLAVADDRGAGPATRYAAVEAPLAPTDRILGPWYLRFTVRTHTGIVADLAHALGAHAIDVEALHHQPIDHGVGVPLAMTVAPCDPHMLARALVEIALLDFHVGPSLAVPILR